MAYTLLQRLAVTLCASRPVQCRSSLSTSQAANWMLAPDHYSTC